MDITFHFIEGLCPLVRYECETFLRDAKWVQPSLLQRAPQDPNGNLSMTESVLLTLYFNSLHVRFHVDLLEGHQQHH